MADGLIGELRPWIDNSAFRAHAAKLLSLSQEAVHKLVALIEKHGTYDVPPREVAELERACGIDGDGRGVLAAARLIRSALLRVEQAERVESLIDFAVLMGVEPFVPEDLSELFSPLPELDKEDLRIRAIGMAPTLAGVSLSTDLRVVSDENVECGLVPVVLARLEFDEPVAGQHALFIQISEDSLGKLESEIKKAKEVLQLVRSRFGSELLA